MTRQCEDKLKLMDQAQEALASICELVTQQRQALRAGADNTVDALDKRLEHLMGEKERRLGALRQHEKEHGC